MSWAFWTIKTTGPQVRKLWSILPPRDSSVKPRTAPCGPSPAPWAKRGRMAVQLQRPSKPATTTATTPDMHSQILKQEGKRRRGVKRLLTYPSWGLCREQLKTEPLGSSSAVWRTQCKSWGLASGMRLFVLHKSRKNTHTEPNPHNCPTFLEWDFWCKLQEG